MKVLFCTSEVVPFAKTGGLADVCGTLPKELSALGIDVKVVMPGYRSITDAGLDIETVSSNLSKTTVSQNVDVYFINNDDYFGRDGLYGDSSGDFADNIQRFKYFNIQALEMLKAIDWPCDIIHCHDWHAALIPIYLKEKYSDDPFFTNTKTVLTIHNLAFQGLFPKSSFSELELSESLLADDGFLFYDQVNFLKAGIIHCDELTTVSPQYATDIQTEKYGCGLDGTIRQYKDGVVGILNGLDYDYWNPSNDNLIVKEYDSDTVIEGKIENKIELQKDVQLPVNVDIPVFGFVGRISHQKGMDLIIDGLNEMDVSQMQVVIQGLGDETYQNRLTEIMKQNTDNVSLSFEFNERLAHRIYAGSDWFLMPSQFEPCGLTQMISMNYGTPPIVYRTGGLADTVQSFDAEELVGNGIVYQENSSTSFVNSMQSAVELFQNRKNYIKLVSNAMESKFPWQSSAKKYKELYQCLLSD